MRNGSLPVVLGGERLFRETIPLVRPLVPEFEGMEAQIRDVLATGQLTKGRYVAEFEARVADQIGVRHAIAVSSCTVGLMLAYRALDLEGEVLMPSFTFMATAHALKWCGGDPAFVDVDPEGWNIDPRSVEARITARTRAIVGVHVFGNPAPVAALERIAGEHRLRLVFDAAHGFGALHEGRPLGRYGDVEVFSTSPTKLLATGEGGVVTTDDEEIAERVRTGREYGNLGAYDCRQPGLNGRMPELSALLGIHALGWVERHAQRRNRLADLYRQRLSRLPGLSFQKVSPGDRCSYKDLSLTVAPDEFGLTRDDLAAALKAEGIDTRNYYDPPVHRLEAYRSPGWSQQLPRTEALASSMTSLPLYYAMQEEKVEGICHAIERLQAHAEAVHNALEREAGLLRAERQAVRS